MAAMRGARAAKGRTGVRLSRAGLALTFVIAAAAGAGGGLTLASFSNTTQNPGNSFQAATLQPATGLSVSETCAGGGIAFRASASAGTDGPSLAISKPTGVVEGDLMVAVVTSRASTDNPSPPTGWTELRNDTNGIRQKIWYRVAGASEPTSYTFSNSGRAGGGIVAYSGVDTANPIDVHNAQTASSSSITAPSITTTVANARLVGVFGINDNSAMSSPAAMSQRFTQASSGSGGSGHHIRVNAADETFVGPGATGTRTATSSISTVNIGALIALRPVPTQWDASLSWTATSTTWASGYKVQRWSGGSMQNEQTVTPRTTTTALDGTLAANTSYEFRVLAYYGTWRSAAATVTLATGSSCGAGSGGGGQGGTYAAEVMTDSPVAYWRLGDSAGTTAVDEQGTHDGTYAGGVTLGQAGALAGDANTSVRMDGNDDHAIRNPFNGMPSSAITVEFWMKSSDTTKTGTPVSYAVSSTENNEFLIFNYTNFQIHVDGLSVSTGVAGNDGAWHHVAITWRSSDGQARLYKDGVQAWSGTVASGRTIANGGSLVLAQEQDAVGGGFDVNQALLGNMDEVAIYNTVLSATRIQAHYDAGT